MKAGKRAIRFEEKNRMRVDKVILAEWIRENEKKREFLQERRSPHL